MPEEHESLEAHAIDVLVNVEGVFLVTTSLMQNSPSAYHPWQEPFCGAQFGKLQSSPFRDLKFSSVPSVLFGQFDSTVMSNNTWFFF